MCAWLKERLAPPIILIFNNWGLFGMVGTLKAVLEVFDPSLTPCIKKGTTLIDRLTLDRIMYGRARPLIDNDFRSIWYLWIKITLFDLMSSSKCRTYLLQMKVIKSNGFRWSVECSTDVVP